MNALSKLLVKVSKRVLTHNPTNEELLQTADRVILWRNADYITDAQVDEIASVMPEEAAETPEQEPIAEEPAFESEPETQETEQETEQEAELDPYKFQGLTPAEVWASLSYRPTKAEYKLACDWLQIAYEPTATNAELRALLAAAAGIEE